MVCCGGFESGTHYKAKMDVRWEKCSQPDGQLRRHEQRGGGAAILHNDDYMTAVWAGLRAGGRHIIAHYVI